MDEEKICSETSYLIQIINSLLGQVKIEDLKKDKMGASYVTSDEKRKYVEALFDRFINGSDLNLYMEMLEKLIPPYIKSVNSFYNTNFSDYRDCIGFVSDKMKERSGEHGLY